jgi:hypothetical protein
MTFISFTAGTVLGILIMLVLLWILVRRVTGSADSRNQAMFDRNMRHMDETERLMQERNELDKRKAEALENLSKWATQIRGFTN